MYSLYHYMKIQIIKYMEEMFMKKPQHLLDNHYQEDGIKLVKFQQMF